jgi:phage shock protein PspC (stress-responsive transcriptional regulator)
MKNKNLKKIRYYFVVMIICIIIFIPGIIAIIIRWLITDMSLKETLADAKKHLIPPKPKF